MTAVDGRRAHRYVRTAIVLMIIALGFIGRQPP